MKKWLESSQFKKWKREKTVLSLNILCLSVCLSAERETQTEDDKKGRRERSKKEKVNFSQD